MVGRSLIFELYPFSITELYRNASNGFFIETCLDKILRFGMYPTVWNKGEEEAKKELELMVNGYLYKDILTFGSIKKSDSIICLLQCLALQLGSEVSFRELSQTLKLSVDTVQRYIELLKRCYIIFSLPALSKNMRNEIGGRNTRKIYFYDVGIRNSLIGNYSPMRLRSDVGGLWENFCIVELIKKAQRENTFYRHFFWRNYNKQEVDYIQRIDENIIAYEFKYRNNRRVKVPRSFLENYNPCDFRFIHKDNFLKEILKENH